MVFFLLDNNNICLFLTDVKLEDIKSMRPPKRRLYQTNDLYYAACSFCKVTPVSNFLKQCTSFRVDLKNSFMSACSIFSFLCGVVRSLVFYVLFVDRNLTVCPFSFGHSVVSPPSICGFWLPLWPLQNKVIPNNK